MLEDKFAKYRIVRTCCISIIAIDEFCFVEFVCFIFASIFCMRMIAACKWCYFRFTSVFDVPLSKPESGSAHECFVTVW